MVKDFDPVTCASEIVNGSGLEKTKNQKLMVLMEVLKTAMKNPADANIADINLSSIVQSDADESIDSFNIDALSTAFSPDIQSLIYDKTNKIKNLIKTFASLNPAKIDINSFYINISDGGKDIEDAIRNSARVSIGADDNLLELIVKTDANMTAVYQEFVAMNLGTLTSMSKPIADIGSENFTVMEGLDVNLSAMNSFDVNGYIVSYEWKEENNILASTPLFSKNDFSVGEHEIVLTVTDNDGVSNSDDLIVTITANPNPPTPVNSKLFVNGQENNTSFGAELSVGSKLENVNLTFSPTVNGTQGSSFKVEFTNGGFENMDYITLCSQNQSIGTIISKGDNFNSADGMMPDARFQFNTDANESLIMNDSNITFHHGIGCEGVFPAIVTNAIANDVISVVINDGKTSSGLEFSDYDTNTVIIATVISSIFTTIGSDSSALQTPNGGETWVYDSNETISWNNDAMEGYVDLYVLHDDPSNLSDFSSTSTELLNNKNWYKFKSKVFGDSVTINPRELNGEGDTYIILIIAELGMWDISDNTFTLINNSSSYILKKTGQTKSYAEDGTEVLDNTLKDDGFYQKGADTNYTRDDNNETVTDHLTGLMWQDDPAVASVTKQWVTQANYDAQDYNNTVGDTATTYCNELVMGGFEDWRLPTVVELQGIVNDERVDPSIDEVFVNSSNSYYWSSTTYHSTHTYAWVVYFGYGNTDLTYKYNSYAVRCVRSRQ
jgi:hypothetical protein